MLFTIQIDKVELNAVVNAAKDVMASMSGIMTAFGEKNKLPEFKIPTVSKTTQGPWGRTMFDVSPTGVTVMLEIRPECTADFIAAYAKMLGMVAIPAAQLVVACMMLDGQITAVEAAFTKKWLVETPEAEAKGTPEAEAKAS